MAAPMAGHISLVVDNYETAFKILSEEDNTQLFLISKTHHLKLAPKYLGNLKAGVKAHLKCFLTRFDKNFEGVPIAYKNVKIQQRMGRMLTDQACVHLDITADFIVFKPTIGCKLRGKINQVKKNHIGCLVHDCFNAWMLQSMTTQKWALDKLLGSRVDFEVVNINSKNNVLSMRGNFLALVTDKNEIDQGLAMMKPEKPLTRVDKFGTHKKKTDPIQPLPIPDLDSVLDDGNETIIARGGAGLGELNDSINEGGPLITSTQVPNSLSETDGKKKHKKKKKKHALEETELDGAGDLGNSADKNAVRVDSEVDGNTEQRKDTIENDTEATEGELTKIKKKKKKHKRKESDGDVSMETSGLMNGNGSEASLDVNDNRKQSSGEMDRVSDQEGKAKKKKRKRSHSESAEGADKSADTTEELFSPRKKLKKDKSLKNTSELSIVEEGQKVSKKHKKHKHKRDMVVD